MVAGWELTRRREARALDKNVNEVKVLVEQFEDKACAEHNQVELLRHERYIRCFAAAARRAQVDGDDENSEQAHKLSKQRHNQQNILVEYVDDEVPASNRSIGENGCKLMDWITHMRSTTRANAEKPNLRPLGPCRSFCRRPERACALLPRLCASFPYCIITTTSSRIRAGTCVLEWRGRWLLPSKRMPAHEGKEAEKLGLATELT